MTLGMVGDLCCEVQWISLRIQTVRCCLYRCQDLGLIARLQSELDGYGKRCLEINNSIKLLQKSYAKRSLQVNLLEEMLHRCLTQLKINRMF